MKIWLKSKKFFMQILVLTVSLFLLLCILFTAITFINAKKSTANAIYQSESERNTDLLRQSNIYWMQLISLGASFTDIAVPYKDLNSSNNYFTRSIFDSMLDSHLKSNSYTANINVVIDGHSLSPTQIPHDINLGKFYIFDVYTQKNYAWPYAFDLVTKQGIQFNQVTITVNGYHLSKQLFTYKTEERLDYLLTQDNIIILSNQQNSFFQNIEAILPGIELENFVTKNNTIPTYNDYYYTLSEPDKYDFRILSLVPQSSYSHQYTTITLQTLLMSALLLLVALIISVLLTFRFYRPVKKTVDLLLTYVPDNIHEYENEIAFIHQNIKKYVDKENNPEPIISETLSRIQNAQTAVMQYQINSHFLFNTLENIKAISVTELGIDNEIENSIFLLNTIIKEGVFQKNIFIPLSHEIYLTKCYLELMLMRFSDVAIYWEEDDSLAQCQVFKFSLQPVLENCFIHAFPGDIGRQKEIYICIRREDNDFTIIITDNGIGFEESNSVSPEQLLQAQDSDDILKQDTYTASERKKSCHVGIRNIHKRITDIFGPDYGIHINNASPGTIVVIRYPVVITPPLQ